jgi:hypothetical protein
MDDPGAIDQLSEYTFTTAVPFMKFSMSIYNEFCVLTVVLLMVDKRTHDEFTKMSFSIK